MGKTLGKMPFLGDVKAMGQSSEKTELARFAREISKQEKNIQKLEKRLEALSRKIEGTPQKSPASGKAASKRRG